MYKLMLVEDEPPILEMLCGLVQSGGYDLRVCATAANGRSALQQLEKMRELPDVLLTDIEMPMIDGMELIKQVNLLYPQIICVILSGHSDFEYARTAVRLRVFDYLLKPITAGNLDELMQKLLVMLRAREAQSEKLCIQSAISSQPLPSHVPKSFHRGQFHVVLLIAGHLCNQHYDAIGSGKTHWSAVELPRVAADLTVADDIHWLLDGRYPNEKILVVKTENPQFSSLSLCQALQKRLGSPRIPINLFYGQGVDSLASLPVARTQLVKTATQELIYAQSRIYQSGETHAKTLIVTQELERQLAVLASQRDFKQCQGACKALLEDLRKKDCTQLQLQTILQYYVLRISPADQPDALRIDVGELLWESMDYERLWENLCCGIQACLNQGRQDKQPAAKDLVDRLEAYLIANYNQNITSKDFFTLFGYNENYLTNVFRSNRGISPNKFLTKLRIQKARELLDQNPEIMIRVVAELVGYEDSLYFSRVFKSAVGRSPSEYVKACGKERL